MAHRDESNGAAAIRLIESKPKKVLAEAKVFWGIAVLVATIFVAGAIFPGKLRDLIYGKNAEARLMRIENRQDLLDEKYAHLHEDVLETRKDLRTMQAGVKLPPLTTETPWPAPHPTETP